MAAFRPIPMRLDLEGSIEQANAYHVPAQPASSSFVALQRGVTLAPPAVLPTATSSTHVKITIGNATSGRFIRPSASPRQLNPSTGMAMPRNLDVLDVDDTGQRPAERRPGGQSAALPPGARVILSPQPALRSQLNFSQTGELSAAASLYARPFNQITASGLSAPAPPSAPAAASVEVVTAAVSAKPDPTPAVLADVDVHSECDMRILQIEGWLKEEQEGREADRQAAAAREAQSIEAAVAKAVAEAVPNAVATTLSKQGLRIAEMQRALEGEKLRCVELETALMEGEASHEKAKSGWAIERQSMLVEAEVGYAGLARSVTDRAQASIMGLKTELQDVAFALDSERASASEALARALAREASACDEARRAGAAGGDAMVRELRRQLDSEREMAFRQQEELQSQLQAMVHDAQDARSALIEQVEVEAAVVIDAAKAESALLRTQLESERHNHTTSLERVKREYEAQCKGFESRLRARVSRTISLLRENAGKPDADLTTILSPLLGTMPMSRSAVSPVQSQGSSPTTASTGRSIGQPVFVESPGAPLQAQVKAEAHETRASARGQSPAPTTGRALNLDAEADRLLATADDVLASVLAAMTPEQRELWQSMERRMQETGVRDEPSVWKNRSRIHSPAGF